MGTQLDLTQYSLTFPVLPVPCISRTAWASWIYDRFSERQKCIIVQDADGAGKTTLLAQFAKTYPDRAFSFFIKPDQYISTVKRFLQELCRQMYVALHGIDQEFDGDTDQLKQVFGNLYGQVAKLARARHENYYFIIDGLEWLSEDIEGERFLKALPTHPYANMYLLASSRPNQAFKFEYYPVSCPPITELEIAKYFEQAGLSLKQSALDQIFKVCNRMPGYLDQLRRELLDSPGDIDVITEHLPSGYTALLERYWSQLGITDDTLLKGLGIIAFSQTPITMLDLARMLDVEEKELREKLGVVGWVMHTEHRLYVGDAQRAFLADKLASRRIWVEKTLIEHYSRDVFSAESIERLPVLLKEARAFPVLQELINANYLNRTLQEQQELFLLRRNTRLVAEAANEERNWQAMLKYTLMNSILSTLSENAVLESEVDALLALREYEQSYTLASRSILLEDRLQLIAKIASRIVETGEAVPGMILSELEQLASQVNPVELPAERLSEISAELFYVLPGAAIDLINRYGGPSVEDRSLDTLLVMLTTKLERDTPDQIEPLRTRIKDRRLQDFTRAQSSIVASLSAESVLSRAESVEDISAKLFLLRSWCNSNRETPEALSVVRVALELITAAEPNPSMRHLRQFAEPLLYRDSYQVIELVERFDLLKDTALSHPVEESIRLDLILAAVEARHTSDGRASSRFYKRFYDLFEQVHELDSRCYGLVRMLNSLPDIIPNDDALRIDLEKHLLHEFDQLLNVSAYHFSLTRRILGPLANYDAKLALEFAEKLNTEERRNSARVRIGVVYSDRDLTTIDFRFLAEVFRRISNPVRRNWAAVQVLEHLARSAGKFGVPPTVRNYLHDLLRELEQITDPIALSLAFAYAFKLYIGIDSKMAGLYFDKMLRSWESVDASWDKLQLGFNLVTLIAENNQEKAKKIFHETRQLQNGTPLIQSVFAKIYGDLLLLASRAIPGIAKATKTDLQSVAKLLISGIEQIPSRATQCNLFADLALRFQLGGQPDEFARIVKERVVPLLDSIEQVDLRSGIAVEISPCLFVYERSFLFEELRTLNVEQRDKALSSVLEYILFGRPSSDPIDVDNSGPIEDFHQALRYCEVLEQISTDTIVFSYVDRLVDSMISKQNGKNWEERCRLQEKHALAIAKRVRILIDSKLPDQTNIKHPGYKIAANACLARLRASLPKEVVRARENWLSVAPSWEEIAAQARRLVPNLADQALVLTWVGKQMYRSEMKVAHQLLEEASEALHNIPNVIDRSHRLQVLADVWSDLDDKSTAKILLQEAMTILEAWNWDATRDQATGSILEVAHKIDPEFAAGLVSMVDNPVQRQTYRESIIVKNLKREPKTLSKHEHKVNNVARMHSKLAREWLVSLCTGRGMVQTDEQVLYMIRKMVGARFDEFYDVAAWSIENYLARTERLNAPATSNLYEGFYDALELTTLLGTTIVGQGRDQYRVPFKKGSVPIGLQLFSVGTREEALVALHRWIQENANEYLKIYDPYFTHEQLDLLKHVPSNVQVSILTTWKAQTGLQVGNVRDAEARYRAEWWKEISDQSPPPTRIFLFGTKSTGSSPLHERYYISSNGRGIRLGTSESGLGKKDSEIREMTQEETASIERQFVDRMIINPPVYHEGERLISSVVDIGQ